MSVRDTGWVRAHTDDEDDWRRWEESPIKQVDLAIHSHYLAEHLSAGERVLEIGAGGGRFTQEIAGITKKLVVADISPEKLTKNKRNAQALGYADSIEAWRECDMTDLSEHFKDREFDAVVCFGGPLSYVFDRRQKAIDELYRIIKPGGIMLLSAKSLFGTLHEHLPRILEFHPSMNREIIETGNMGPRKVAAASRFWHAFRANEFAEFIAASGAEVVTMSASNCLSATWADVLSAYRSDRKVWNHLIDLEIEACRQPGCLDMGSHILAVAKKPR